MSADDMHAVRILRGFIDLLGVEKCSAGDALLLTETLASMLRRKRIAVGATREDFERVRQQGSELAKLAQDLFPIGLEMNPDAAKRIADEAIRKAMKQ